MLKNIVTLAVLLFLSAFFSCAELAVLSVNPNKIRLRAEQGDKKAILLKKTLDDPDKFLSTNQLAKSLVDLFSSAYAGQMFAEPVISLMLKIGISVPVESLRSVVVLIITVILSYFILVFGELVPKSVALKRSEAMSDVVVGPVNFLSIICGPFVRLLSASSNAVVTLMGIDINEDTDQVTEEEIRLMVDTGSEKGNIDESEMEMINNVFEFDDKSVEDIAVHRTDITAIDIDDGLREIMPVIWRMKYSRMPVYRDNLDNIIGVLHIKDLMKYMLENNINPGSSGEIDLMPLLRKPYFVPTSKKTDELFAEMKYNKVHIAIVVDEYGGTAGIVTMEDLIEEIMGSILDEYDDEEVLHIRELDAGTFEILGITSINEVEEALGTDLPDEEYETIGGFLIGQLGYIPSHGEKPEVEFNGVLYKVLKAEDKRILEILACKAEWA